MFAKKSWNSNVWLGWSGQSFSSKNMYMVRQFSAVQSLSRVRLFATPWSAARQASLSITNSQSLPKLMSIESVMPSNHLILFSCLQSFPASGSFQMSELFTSGSQSIGVSASTSVLLMNTQWLWSPPKIKSATISTVSPSICREVMEPDAAILVFWTLSFKPTFSLSSFTFIRSERLSSLLHFLP